MCRPPLQVVEVSFLALVLAWALLLVPEAATRGQRWRCCSPLMNPYKFGCVVRRLLFLSMLKLTLTKVNVMLRMDHAIET